MNFDKLAKELQSDDVVHAEVVTYRKSQQGLTRQTIAFRFFDDGDYTWTTTLKPLSPLVDDESIDI